MIKQTCSRYTLWSLIFFVSGALPLLAQQRGGGGGGFGGGAGGRGGTGGSGSTSTSPRTYPNNGTIGDAYFSIDPETRRVVYIADEATSKYITQVLTNLDRPKRSEERRVGKEW